MVRPLQWWVIPGALVVLLRVVTLDGASTGDRGPGAPAEASAPMAEVAVLDAAGRRLGPSEVDFGGAAIVALPAEYGGRRGRMTVWRRLDGRREATPWLDLRPRVRGDGTIPIAGLAGGRYDLELEFRDAAPVARFVATDAVVPGRIVVTEPR